MVMLQTFLAMGLMVKSKAANSSLAKLVTQLNSTGQPNGSKFRNESANLKRLPSHIGSNPPDANHSGVFSSMSTVGKQATSTTRCIRIIKSSFLFTVTRAATTPSLIICWRVMRWINGYILQPPIARQKRKSAFTRTVNLI